MSGVLKQKYSLNQVLELIADDATYFKNEMTYYMGLLGIRKDIHALLQYEREGLLSNMRSTNPRHSKTFNGKPWRICTGVELKKALVVLHERKIKERSNVVGQEEKKQEVGQTDVAGAEQPDVSA